MCSREWTDKRKLLIDNILWDLYNAPVLGAKGFIYMKWLLILGAIFFAYSYFSNDKKSNSSEIVQYSESQQVTSVSHSKPAPVQPSHNFKCDGREHCSQMSSKAEAEFFLKNCPNVKMDGDGDGIPCESQFP